MTEKRAPRSAREPQGRPWGAVPFSPLLFPPWAHTDVAHVEREISRRFRLSRAVLPARRVVDNW